MNWLRPLSLLCARAELLIPVAPARRFYAALAEQYSHSTGRTISDNQVLCFPGTQTALFAVCMGVAETGCEVIVGDPMYATYEGVIRATGADVVPVPLKPQCGFRIAAGDIADRLTSKTSVFADHTAQPYRGGSE